MVTEPFVPPDYASTLAALDAAGVSVATVLACPGGNCPVAQEQADKLAADLSSGAVRGTRQLASEPTEVAAKSVDAVLDLLQMDRVSARVEWAPSDNSDPMTGEALFEATVAPLPVSSNHCLGNDGVAYTDCRPGAAAEFDIQVRELSKLGVPPGPLPDGSYEFTLRVEGERNGVMQVLEERPLIVKPSLVALMGAYDTGFYSQDAAGQGCEADASRRPSWDELVFDADVLPDTALTLSVCTADSASDLAGCGTGAPETSGLKRVLTMSAGAGNGTPCTADTEEVDCSGGYCSPYTDRCVYLEGTACSADAECPGAEVGSCRGGPNSATLGNTCAVPGRVASPAMALGPDNFRPYFRMQADLTSMGELSRTPSLYYWEARYFCRAVE